MSEFHLIDRQSWEREAWFDHYFDQVPCTYSMTAEIDVTLLAQMRRRSGRGVFAPLLWMIARVINWAPQYRTSQDEEGNLGIWDELWPGYTVFHPENHTFSTTWTQYDSSFVRFERRLQADLQQARLCTGFCAKEEPPNLLNVSAVPWVRYSAFQLNLPGSRYLLPIITMGKLSQQGERTLLPLTFQGHHAVCDGWHAGQFFTESERLAGECVGWLGDDQA